MNIWTIPFFIFLIAAIVGIIFLVMGNRKWYSWILAIVGGLLAFLTGLFWLSYSISKAASESQTAQELKQVVPEARLANYV